MMITSHFSWSIMVNYNRKNKSLKIVMIFTLFGLFRRLPATLVYNHVKWSTNELSKISCKDLWLYFHISMGVEGAHEYKPLLGKSLSLVKSTYQISVPWWVRVVMGGRDWARILVFQYLGPLRFSFPITAFPILT